MKNQYWWKLISINTAVAHFETDFSLISPLDVPMARQKTLTNFHKPGSLKLQIPV